ncbi:hypothetical protein KKD70_01795 [Patescibacteria group bacterium]|nr:hypothetical protein [Patescibacteria group bacterium]
MKNTHKAIATLAIISALGATTAFAASENANNANSDSTTRPQFQRGSQERMENRPQFTEMNAAIESGDYEAWVALHDGRNSALLDVINADNFSKLKEMHEARQSGDIETAEAIASELGLPTPPQGRMGGNGMKGQGRSK